MSDLAKALQLMHLAHEKASTIQAEVRIRRHHELTRRAWERWSASSSGSTTTLTFASTDQVASAPEAFKDETYRVWTQRPGWLWRVERQQGGRLAIDIYNGRHFWIDFGDGTYTNQRSKEPEGRDPDSLIADIFDPSAPLTLFRLSFEGDAESLGRRCYRLRGLPKRHGEADDYRRSWYYADSHELWIDAEFGVLLRYDAFLDGELMARSEMTTVSFNEPIDPQLFLGPDGAEAAPQTVADLPESVRDGIKAALQQELDRLSE